MVDELTERERFILHAVMASLTIESDPNIKIPHEHILGFIHKNRCRNLSMGELNQLIEQVRMEMELAKTMWDEFGASGV